MIYHQTRFRCNLLTQYSWRANSSPGSMFARETNRIDIFNFRIISRPLVRDNTSEIKIERHSLEIHMDFSRHSILSLSVQKQAVAQFRSLRILKFRMRLWSSSSLNFVRCIRNRRRFKEIQTADFTHNWMQRPRSLQFEFRPLSKISFGIPVAASLLSPGLWTSGEFRAPRGRCI